MKSFNKFHRELEKKAHPIIDEFRKKLGMNVAVVGLTGYSFVRRINGNRSDLFTILKKWSNREGGNIGEFYMTLGGGSALVLRKQTGFFEMVVGEIEYIKGISKKFSDGHGGAMCDFSGYFSIKYYGRPTPH